MQRSEYTSANRRAWNEAAPAQDTYRLSQMVAEFDQPGHNCLSAAATQILKQIGLSGKSVAQLCCNNGQELLSIKNLGAARCVGFDIADNFIDQARQLAQSSRVNCQFVRTDVYDIAPQYYDHFDVVYISVGTFGWMPDIREFFRVISRLLKPEGWLVVHELHPILDMYESDTPIDPPQIQHSYFRTIPFEEDNGQEYTGLTIKQPAPSYWFHHKMSDIISAGLAASLQLRSFQEYEHDISGMFARFENMKVRLPLSYTLVMQKAQ
jgi:ubiquinone/menaquinone biosynthesis C-methylase UbiE